MPRVSVILTTHRPAPYLDQAIASVLAQTYEDWQLIVVSDGPMPASTLFERRVRVDQRVSGFEAAVSPAVECRFAATINQAFKMCEGEYITYLCHDDLYLPWRLEVMLQYLQASYSHVVFGYQQLLECFGPDGELSYFGEWRKGDPDNPAGTVDHSSVLHSRECFEKAGGWDEQAPMRYGDAYFWMRLQCAGYKFHFIPRLLDVHRFNVHSVTWKIDSQRPSNDDDDDDKAKAWIRSMMKVS